MLVFCMSFPGTSHHFCVFVIWRWRAMFDPIEIRCLDHLTFFPWQSCVHCRKMSVVYRCILTLFITSLHLYISRYNKWHTIFCTRQHKFELDRSSELLQGELCRSSQVQYALMRKPSHTIVQYCTKLKFWCVLCVKSVLFSIVRLDPSFLCLFIHLFIF